MVLIGKLDREAPLSFFALTLVLILKTPSTGMARAIETAPNNVASDHCQERRQDRVGTRYVSEGPVIRHLKWRFALRLPRGGLPGGSLPPFSLAHSRAHDPLNQRRQFLRTCPSSP